MGRPKIDPVKAALRSYLSLSLDDQAQFHRTLELLPEFASLIPSEVMRAEPPKRKRGRPPKIQPTEA